MSKIVYTWVSFILITFTLFLTSFLIGCAPRIQEVLITQEVEVTREIEVTKLVIITATPVPPTETPTPTNTPEPTPVTPTVTPETKTDTIAKNFPLIQEQNGVQVILERVLVSDPDSDVGLRFKSNDSFQNKSVYVQPVITVINNTDKIIKMSFAGDILVMVNGEQVSYSSFMNILFMPEYSKDILPGAKVIGPAWVAFSQVKWNQVTNIAVRIPHFTSDDNKITDDFIFQIEVDNWGFEPLPEHLK